MPVGADLVGLEFSASVADLSQVFSMLGVRTPGALRRREGFMIAKLMAVGAAGALVLAAGSAIAADLARPVYKAPPVPVETAYDWTAFYIGGHGSFSSANSTSTTTNTATGAVFPSVSGSTSGWHGGGQVGFDYMLPSRIVLGVQASVQSGGSNSSTNVEPLGTNQTQSKTFESGSVRGRLGYAIDRVLLYGTGGWAWANGQAMRSQLTGTVGLATPGTVETVNVDHTGWTAGFGIAVAFWQNWDAFAEYNYSNFQNANVTFPLAQRSTNTTTNSNAIAFGVDYRFNWGNPVVARY
jgi:outer membrane immunogenic protein